MAKKTDKPTTKDALAEMTADLQRVQADFVNFRRRAEEERRELLTLAKVQVVGEILPLLDNMDRVLKHVPDSLKDNQWAEGVRQVAKQVEGTLKDLGVEIIEAEGQPFDPNMHEAVSMDDGEGDTEVVIEVLQPGYRLGERVLRPAMVKVGRR